MNREVTVRAEDLTRKFGQFVAVDHVTFSVSEGEIFGFLGSNGAGKTTTIRMLCGLLKPSGGNGSVGGFDIRTEAEQIKQNIGYMSQRFSLYDELTVEENMEFFSGVYSVPSRIRAQRIREVLERMDLLDRKASPAYRLPGGWKQRLALGCAIVHNPDILFLDEPTSGVDPIARRTFWDLIYQLSEEGHTVFVTTHYMDEAEFCHRLALMDAGRIIALDSPEALRKGLSGSLYLQLEVSDTREALRVLSRSGDFEEVIISGGGLKLRVLDQKSAENQVRKALRDSGVEVRDLYRVEPVMEDVFVSSIEESRRET